MHFTLTPNFCGGQSCQLLDKLRRNNVKVFQHKYFAILIPANTEEFVLMQSVFDSKAVFHLEPNMTQGGVIKPKEFYRTQEYANLDSKVPFRQDCSF